MAALDTYYEELSKLENPSKKFDKEYYLKTYPDVARDPYYGSRAQEHYETRGINEGRIPNKEQENILSGVTQNKINELRLKIQQEEGYGSLAKQIESISKTRPQVQLANIPEQLSAQRNFGASDLASRLNFQVSDQQIIDDLNASRIQRLNSIYQNGNAQLVAIQDRIKQANELLAKLPASDPRRTASEAAVATLTADLKSVNDAVSEANRQIKEYKPIGISDLAGQKEITSFREYLQLPEERATQQLKQIDPQSYEASVELGKKYRQLVSEPIASTISPETLANRQELERAYMQKTREALPQLTSAQTEAFRSDLERKYREMAMSPIGPTTSAQAEALRRQVEGEALSQLRLGAQLGAEEQRQYQQAARAAQAARGNIFGVAPAVEEAVTTGAAGEQRKLARYGAAGQFLASGQTTSDALARDVQLRQALQQQKLGAAGQFMASGQTVSDAIARNAQLQEAIAQSRLGGATQFMASGQTAEDVRKSDIAFRDALLQSRLGAAAGFISGGPTLYNLGQARAAQQQQAMQAYIQANQPIPGQFAQAPSTAQPFYQATQPGTAVDLTNTFANLYGSLANYQASTYGNYVGAVSRQPTGAQQFGAILSGLSGLVPSFSFSR